MRDRELEKRVDALESKLGRLGWECATCRRFYPTAKLVRFQKSAHDPFLGSYDDVFWLCEDCLKAVKDAK